MIPVITVFVRHSAGCSEFSDPFFKRCSCKKHLRWFHGGKQHTRSAKSRTWAGAEDAKRKLEKSFELGDSPTQSPAKIETIREKIATYITRKESEGVTPSIIRKLKYQLGLFDSFMADRAKILPAELTPTDVIQFRASWTWGDLTQIKAQTTLRSFIRHACTDNRQSLLDALGQIKETREGKERRKPKPLSEEDIQKLLEQIPITFVCEPEKIRFFHTLIRTLVSTGLAIVDAVQLQRSALERADKTQVLEIERQKTGKTAMIPIDRSLLNELLVTLNGNPKYVFWSGNGMADSKTKNLNHEMQTLMEDAGVYIKGNLFHRFRDSAVDTWLGLGWSLTDVASALGDTLTVVEKHYKDWASQRQRARLAALPVRKWN